LNPIFLVVDGTLKMIPLRKSLLKIEPRRIVWKIKKSMPMIHCPDCVGAGRDITKERRQEIFGQVAGGAGSRGPEVFQKAQIVAGTGVPCSNTQTRINWRALKLVDIHNPMTKDDGFDYTENFDARQEFGTKKVYINLKCVVGKGGSQTRTLRDECYQFIDAQLRYLLKNPEGQIWFANIFDGDEADRVMKKFQYLLGLAEFRTVRQRVYVGDLRGYFQWARETVAE
jgi:hypothetical protein